MATCRDGHSCLHSFKYSHSHSWFVCGWVIKAVSIWDGKVMPTSAASFNCYQPHGGVVWPRLFTTSATNSMTEIYHRGLTLNLRVLKSTQFKNAITPYWRPNPVTLLIPCPSLATSYLSILSNRNPIPILEKLIPFCVNGCGHNCLRYIARYNLDQLFLLLPYPFSATLPLTHPVPRLIVSPTPDFHFILVRPASGCNNEVLYCTVKYCSEYKCEIVYTLSVICYISIYCRADRQTDRVRETYTDRLTQSAFHHSSIYSSVHFKPPSPPTLHPCLRDQQSLPDTGGHWLSHCPVKTRPGAGRYHWRANGWPRSVRLPKTCG